MLKPILLCAALTCLGACAVPFSKHPLEPATLGAPVAPSYLAGAFARPGPIRMEKMKLGTWRFGVRYCDPAPAECKLKARVLDAEIYAYLVEHPDHGTFLIDAGFPADHEDEYGWLLRRALGAGDDRLMVTQTLGDALAARGAPDIQGVFLTHLHFDHVQGVSELSPDVPLYISPGAGSDRHIYFRLIGKPLRAALKERGPLRSLPFQTAEDLVDIFGDGSLIAVHVPGHTNGSTAYFVNTETGAHLITGDAVMDVASWQGPEREAQTFKPNVPNNWASRQRLRDLAAQVSGLTVHPGHESFPESGPAPQ